MLALDAFFVVLSDANRRRILVLLMHCDELCVCQLMAALALPQPKVSRYLSQIRAAGLVTCRKERTWMHYRLQPNLPPWIIRLLDDLQHEQQGAAQLQGDLARVEAARACAE
jgi:ArsR family transcriptional regulator